MNEKLEQALNAAFSKYGESPALDAIKLEMLAVLEDKFQELRQRGIIEDAAIKKLLSELDRSVKTAERAAGGSKQKRLNRIAAGLGVSPLGRRHAMGRMMSGIIILCGLLSALAYWAARREPAGAVTAMLPFAAVGVAASVFIELTRYRAERSSAPRAKAALAAGAAGAVTAALLCVLASALA